MTILAWLSPWYNFWWVAHNVELLAYIGDVVFELYIRSRHVWPLKRTADLQNTVVALVRGKLSAIGCLTFNLWYHFSEDEFFIAEHQSHLLSLLKAEFPLTDKEKQILMRGRNAVTRSKNRRNPAAYQDSTSFEAFLGYLYIGNHSRCQTVLNWLDKYVDNLADSSDGLWRRVFISRKW